MEQNNIINRWKVYIEGLYDVNRMAASIKDRVESTPIQAANVEDALLYLKNGNHMDQTIFTLNEI